MDVSPRAIWACVTADVGVRMSAIWLASRGSTPWIDPDEYLPRATTLLHGMPWLQALAGDNGQIRPPLYPALLAAGRWIAMPPAWMLILQALASGAACALVIALARRIADGRGALLAGWAFAVSPAWILSAPAFWSEHIDTPLVALALLLLTIARQDLSAMAWIGTGAAFAAAALTRSIPLYVVPVLAAIVMFREPCARRGMAVALTVFTLVAGAYIATATRAAGRLILVENSAEWHWRARSSPDTAAVASLSTVLPAMIHEAQASPIRLGREAISHVRMTFAPAPWNAQTAEQFPLAVTTLLRWADAGFVVLLLGLAFIGARIAHDRTAVLLFGAWIGVHLILIALSSTNAGPRYRAPLDPALLALAAVTLGRI